MRIAERLKMFTGDDIDDLEKEFAEWYDSVVAFRASVPALKGNKFVILERSLVIKNYLECETFGLAVFFEDVILADHEKGKDRGGHLNTGVSMMVGKKR